MLLYRHSLQADHNLLHIVGHANLLQSLAIGLTYSKDQKIQEFDKKLAASNIKADRLDMHPGQAYKINNKVAVFTSKRVPVCSTYVPIIVEEIEVGDEEDEEDEEIDNFTFPDISPQVQPQLIRRLSDQTRACHSKGVSTTASVIDKILASIALDRYFEAAGFTFNK
ncbi:hypothetical protein ONS95_004487 [Cadophora gregata]|uniref:uncharacterized protein n=1 Tax=Cadophora gregata TaxID=51156 RepID=UPI0026DB178D|nr:uncharacterized protein ONS95_004487 [Cadophora gregata]KAK0105978.1 hypothetical protein ONS95_004487 [Cadophora gregata]